MEDSQCRDQRQAGGNCLPTAIAGHTTGNSCSPSFALRVGSSMCVEARPTPTGPAPDSLYICSHEGPAYKEHFGANEHSYSHWLSLDLPAGWWDLARLLFMHPDAASAATPLRLLSWLSFRLEPAVEELIEDTMLYLSTAEKVTMADLLSLGTISTLTRSVSRWRHCVIISLNW